MSYNLIPTLQGIIEFEGNCGKVPLLSCKECPLYLESCRNSEEILNSAKQLLDSAIAEPTETQLLSLVRTWLYSDITRASTHGDSEGFERAKRRLAELEKMEGR